MAEEKTRLIDVDRSIIPACDVQTLQQLERIVQAASGLEKVRAYKVGFSLGLIYGLPAVVGIIKNIDPSAKVIYDHQKASTDIPDTGGVFADTMKRSGVDSAILFPQSGPMTECAYIRALSELGVHVIVGGEMTHAGYLATDGGFIADDSPARMYSVAGQNGVSDFVVPGNKPQKIAEYRQFLKGMGFNPVFYSPGFISQGGDISDAANAAGDRWHAIVGRAVYNPKKRDNLDDVTQEEIRQALEKLVSRI
jgi:orotidine-5'-phosphate decarboxylase